ncbi:MAG: hypothetical protein JSR89_11220 [Proteobacteria bacterium]|nr:hypothetical protein [Pseudomonadota bacterium]
MPRKKRNYTQSDVKYLVTAVEAAGKDVAYVKHCSDDSGFRVVCRADLDAAKKPEPADDWDDLLNGTPQAS